MTPRERLIQAAKASRLVIVVGTGVTASLTQGVRESTWTGLLADGVAKVGAENSKAGDLLSLRLDEAEDVQELTSIANDIRGRLGSNFGRWIARSVGDLPLKVPALAQAIGALRAPILTTNYDTLLEKALGRSSASWVNPSEMRRILVERTDTIGHLHGVWTDADHIVFSDADYSNLTRQTAVEQYQTAAFTMSTFLFIGVGEGLKDPNFDPMVKKFGAGFPDSGDAHFRLCLNSEVDETTELASVIDVGYGDAHSDLVSFIDELASEVGHGEIDLLGRSRAQILHALRDNSTLWRDADTLDDKGFDDLVITPTFLPEPHDQYSTNVVVKKEKQRPEPVDIDELLRADGTVLVVGEENSGISTALAYCLQRALDLRPGAHSLLCAEPQGAGAHPLLRVVDRTYLEWGVKQPAVEILREQILGVDNLRADGTQRFQKAIADIAASPARLKIVAVRQSDVVAMTNALKQSGEDVRISYLGRFSDSEAQTLAERIAPGRGREIASEAMTIIRDKNLPRTPFTLTLLVELVQSGTRLRSEESEIAVLDQYLSLLLGAEFLKVTPVPGMTVRMKRRVLEAIARKFVELKEDHAALTEVSDWVHELFESVGWDNFSVRACLDELIARRVLMVNAEDVLRFQRSAYLELMAGLAAKDDPKFRSMVFEAPLQLATIVRSYAAMARNDASVLELVEQELGRITVGPLRGSAFSSVRRVDAGDELFADRSDASDSGDEGRESDTAVERSGLTGSYYDDSPDEDSPAFLAAHLDELSSARIAMLVVDLASRVLRDSDEVKDQDLKSRVLKKVLLAWVAFTDLYELEVAQYEEIDEVAIEIFGDPEKETSDEERMKLRAFLVRVMSVILTNSGVEYCLSGSTLTARLMAHPVEAEELATEVAVLRLVALLGSGGHEWVDALSGLPEAAVKSFFCASVLAARVRYAFLTDDTLSDSQRDDVRAFLRRVVDARYNFKDVGHRNRVLNDFENQLRQERLSRRGTPKNEIGAKR